MASSGTRSPYRDPDPYTVDKILGLEATLDNFAAGAKSELQVEVKRRTQPWTLSCTMVVKIADDFVNSKKEEKGLKKGDEAFLKLFDRRYAKQLRDDNGLDSWSEDIEQQLLNGLESGKIEDFLHKLHTDKQFQQDTEDDWDAAENEAYLGDELLKCFNAEVATYSALQRYQGEFIPRLLAIVTLDISSPDLVLDDRQRDLCQVKGVLLEYLAGFSLSSMIEHAPQVSWQNIVDQAIHIVHVLGDNNILNTDVRPDNFMVVPREEDGEYRVFMIDFGQCRFRRDDESDADWGRAKWRQDEEGAVGAVMRMKLSKVGFELRYEPSWRYLAWAPGEDD